MENHKEQYTAPELTTVSFKVENGFYGSPQQTLFQTLIFNQVFETYDTKSTWGEDDNHFFD